jgi:argininosuccinate lyase
MSSSPIRFSFSKDQIFSDDYSASKKGIVLFKILLVLSNIFSLFTSIVLWKSNVVNFTNITAASSINSAIQPQMNQDYERIIQELYAQFNSSIHSLKTLLEEIQENYSKLNADLQDKFSQWNQTQNPNGLLSNAAVPPGTIIYFTNTTFLPDGYLIANGNVIPRD